MIHAKKSLGQHFLMHRQIAERIVDAARVTADDVVLEIGPGTGLLTRALLDKAKQVIAIETDQDLIPLLQKAFASEMREGKLKLLTGDVRSFDPAVINEPYLLVANIPYYITGEIMQKFLGTENKPSSITVLVQKEVAIRIARSKKESLASLAVKVYGTPKYQFTVPRGAFSPAPSVDSAVLSVVDISNRTFENVAESRFFEILHAGFAHKRKRLAKNLEEVAPSESITHVFDILGLSMDARAEDVPLASWLTIARHLKAK
jgi:16S rRNA (adenine1518-N6/adenine1519-N6)-dimethyltransferase